jgi:hypothetical protein
MTVQKLDCDAMRMTGRTLVVAIRATVAEIVLKLQYGVGSVEEKRSEGSEDFQFSDDGAAREFANLTLIVKADVGAVTSTRSHVVPHHSATTSPFPDKTASGFWLTMIRTLVSCRLRGAHLSHRLDDGATPAGLRQRMSLLSLYFVKFS